MRKIFLAENNRPLQVELENGVITIVMSIPTIIFSAYGMNLAPSGMPFSSTIWGFLIVILVSFAASIIAALFLSKKKYF